MLTVYGVPNLVGTIAHLDSHQVPSRTCSAHQCNTLLWAWQPPRLRFQNKMARLFCFEIATQIVHFTKCKGLWSTLFRVYTPQYTQLMLLTCPQSLKWALSLIRSSSKKSGSSSISFLDHRHITNVFPCQLVWVFAWSGFCIGTTKDLSFRFFATMLVKDQVPGNVFRGTFFDFFRQNPSPYTHCQDILQSTPCQVEFVYWSCGLKFVYLTIDLGFLGIIEKFKLPAKFCLRNFEWFCL